LTASAALLVGVSLAFAVSMGAHYTGACMGMPYAGGAIRAWPALLLMAPLAFAGAALASQRVQLTVAHGMLEVADAPTALAVVAAAFAVTSLYNRLRVPTSTIQILVFSAVGGGLAMGHAVRWDTIWHLALVWAAAPVLACGLGFLVTLGLDRFLPADMHRLPAHGATAGLLVAVGAAASFAMGANDVANASGPLVMAGVFGVLAAGVTGGAGLAVGVLAWGKPLLRRVAFEIVQLDAAMATAAQLVQALVVLVAVSFGYFTSMNQALVGAMAGAGLARGRTTVRWTTLHGILAGWTVGPLSGAAVAFLLAEALTAARVQ
jgi:PiT family inorganic phosphate transporter